MSTRRSRTLSGAINGGAGAFMTLDFKGLGLNLVVWWMKQQDRLSLQICNMYIIKYKHEVYSEFMMCIYYYTQPVKNSRWLKWFHIIYIVLLLHSLLFYVCKIQQTLFLVSTSEVPRVYLLWKSCSLPIQIPLNFGEDFQYYNVSSISMYNVSFGWWVHQCAHCTMYFAQTAPPAKCHNEVRWYTVYHHPVDRQGPS